MSSDEKLTPERAVRLLRSKGAFLENLVLGDHREGVIDIRLTDLTADIALIAQLVADHIERVDEQGGQITTSLANITGHLERLERLGVLPQEEYPPPSWPVENQHEKTCPFDHENCHADDCTCSCHSATVDH